MNTKSSIMLIASVMTVFGIMMVPGEVSAEPSQNSVTITPINEEISMKKTVTMMTVPSDNTLSWGTVIGGASEYVERYPIIIQFYQGEDPVHFAQVDVRGDGSYEYKFRVQSLDSNTGETVKIFDGDYTVNIFRVIPNTNSQV